MGELFSVGVSAGLLLVAYFTGSYLERAHFESIAKREKASRGMPTLNFETLPPGWAVRERSTTPRRRDSTPSSTCAWRPRVSPAPAVTARASPVWKSSHSARES